MIGHFSRLILLLSLISVASSEAGNIQWKLDASGKKVYYNIPSRSSATGQNGEAVAVYYSNRSADFDHLIQTSCSRHGVDPSLVKAVIQVESGYNHRAVSPKGARGLMQLMPGTAARYGVQSSFDPSQNIEGGVRYLRDLMTLFNSDTRLALAAYNAGEKRVQRINEVPNFVETQNYVRKVLALYNGEESYIPYYAGGKVGTVTYWKYVDDKGVTHYSAEPVTVANATKVSFAYAW